MDSVSAEQFGPICDASPESLTWIRGGRDLAVELLLGDGARRRYTFTWVSRLKIAIEQGAGGPQPLSWDGDAERLSDGRLRVLIDFASQGRITLECQEIVAEPPVRPAATSSEL